MRFTDHLNALIQSRRGTGDPIWQYTGKMEGRALAQQLGIRVPELLVGPFHLGEWPPPPARSPFVLKPVDASNSRGVVPLVSHGAWFRSLWRDGEAPWDGWRTWSAREQQRHQEAGVEPYRGPYIIEELVQHDVGEPSFDWKCYCIHGRVAWVRQLEKRGRGTREARVTCYIVDRTNDVPLWGRLPVDVLTNHGKEVAVLPPPPDAPALLHAAERVAQHLELETGTPFVRVDLYADHEGRPVFGEITPHPSGGRDRYLDRIDELLGARWAGR